MIITYLWVPPFWRQIQTWNSWRLTSLSTNCKWTDDGQINRFNLGTVNVTRMARVSVTWLGLDRDGYLIFVLVDVRAGNFVLSSIQFVIRGNHNGDPPLIFIISIYLWYRVHFINSCEGYLFIFISIFQLDYLRMKYSFYTKDYQNYLEFFNV